MTSETAKALEASIAHWRENELAEVAGTSLGVCSAHLSKRCQQGYLEREARTYRSCAAGAKPFVVYKVTATMLDAYFNYNKHHSGAGRRPVGTKVNRPRVPKPIVEL